MSNGNGTTIKGPWWITVVERTGSLGIVVIMLIGAFFLAKEFTADMRDTWKDIHTIIQAENAAAVENRNRSNEILKTLVEGAASNHQFLETMGKTVTSRLDSMDKRINRLETNVNP